MTVFELRRAADYLHDCAKLLELQFTEKGKWSTKWQDSVEGRNARREHAEMLELAGKLRAEARKEIAERHFD